jgi:hypothetical protein
MPEPVRSESTPALDRLQLLLKRFARAAEVHHAAIESLDTEQAEVQARMLAGLHEALANSGEAGMEKLLELVASRNPVVAGMAAVYTLPRNSGPCLATLRRVAKEPGLLGFRAGMAIERWESGAWGDQVCLPAKLQD